jgi:cytochrome P450
VLKFLYNISPFHPLYKYPGPFLWRASRIPASYHHASGDLYQRIAAIHAQYGDTVRIAPDELSFSAPEAWPQIYNSRPQLNKSEWHFAPGDVERLPPSMITAPDAEHARIRRLAGPAFLNAGIAEVEPVLQHYVDLLCSQLATASTEGSQNIVEWFLWALNDVIGQLALDQEFQCLEKRRMHPWPRFLLSVLKQTAALNQFRRFGLSMKLLQPLMTKKMIDERENFLNLAKTAINQRLARDNEETSGPTVDSEGRKKRPDIVGLMLREMKGGEKLNEGEIMSNSILIVGGGAETTSTCLSATLYHLCKTPHVMNKLKNEIRRNFSSSEEITVKATANLPYLKATVDESLRIFPVASYITPRVTPKEGYNINGDFVGGGVSPP